MRSRKSRRQGGGEIPDSWQISTFLQNAARDAGVFEGEDDDEDYDYNYSTSEWFKENYDQTVANMMTEFRATREEILQGLRDWYNNGEGGMDYYFGWIQDKLNLVGNNGFVNTYNGVLYTNGNSTRINSGNGESINNENPTRVYVGDSVSNTNDNPTKLSGGKRTKRKKSKTRKVKKIKRM